MTTIFKPAIYASEPFSTVLAKNSACQVPARTVMGLFIVWCPTHLHVLSVDYVTAQYFLLALKVQGTLNQ